MCASGDRGVFLGSLPLHFTGILPPVFCLRRSFLEPPPAVTGDSHHQFQGRQKSRFARRESERRERRADCGQRDEFFPAYQTSQFTQSGMVMGVKGGPWGGPRFINTVVSSDRVRTSNASLNTVELCGEKKIILSST